MGVYKDSLIRLHEEYTRRTFVGLMGRQATLLCLLADVYEVALQFDKLLEHIKQGPTWTDDYDLDYLEWCDPKKWVKNVHLKSVLKSTTSKTFGFDEDDQFYDSYSNRMKDALGERLNNFDDKRLHSLFYSIVTSQSVIPDSEFELAIDNNLKHLRETLLEIYKFKKNKVWKKSDYAFMCKDFHTIFLNSVFEKTLIERYHREWLKSIVTEPEKEDYFEWRREILINLFKIHFLDALKQNIRVLPEDDMAFSKIEDKDLMPDLNDTLKYYSAFKRLCPYDGKRFDFANYAALGKYIHDNNIPKVVCWNFFQQISLLEIVQNELEWLDNPNAKPVNDDEVLEEFVDTIKRIMLKAEDENGNVITTKDKRGNETQFEYKVDGKRFCEVIDYITEKYPDLLSNYIGGKNKSNALGVSCVAPFIGAVLRTHIFSCTQLRYKDIEFAFQFVMGEKNKNGDKISYIQKMGNKKDIDEKSIFKSLETIEKELP